MSESAAPETPQPPALHPYLDPENAPLPKSGLNRRWPWVTVLLPFAVYMIIGSVEPSRSEEPKEKPAASKDEESAESDAENGEKSLAQLEVERLRKAKEEEEHHGLMPWRLYPAAYSWKIAVTSLFMLLAIPGYLAYRGRPSMWGVLVGVVGGVAWIGICKLHLEPKILNPLGLGGLIDMGRRPGFNPLTEIADPTWAKQFFAIRMLGLCFVVPIVEEFFLRSFLMRYVMHVDWPLIPFGRVDRLALIAGTAFPMLMHPGELIAALVWFSMVTWLMLKTKSIWDCILAHMITNAMIGLWVFAAPKLLGVQQDLWLM
jgi:CAAX prenyl protease-like protein